MLSRACTRQPAVHTFVLTRTSKLQPSCIPKADGRRKLHLPALSLRQPAKIFSAGVLAGGSGSIVGMGGAFIAIPALTSRWIALTQHKAQATSLAAVLATGAGGAASFALSGAVDWSAASAIAGGGVITANLGAKLASQLPGHMLKSMLGMFMVCTAGSVMLKPMVVHAAQAKEDDEDLERSDATLVENFAKLAVVGCGVGIFAGVFGVGGGAISVPALTLCIPELSHHEAIGTSCAAMMLPAVSGLWRHAQTGALVPSAALPLAIGTACGAFLSARHIALQMDEVTLKSVFAVLLAVLGARTMQTAAAMRRAAVLA